MSRLTICLVLFIALASGTGPARATTLTLNAPPFTLSEGNHTNHGIAFTALDDVTLESFVFVNQGSADTIVLQTPGGGTTLETFSVPAGNPSFSVDAGWDLAAGTTYWLLGTTPTNGRYDFATLPVANAHLQVNNAIFSSTNWGNMWVDFTALTTSDSATVPIPEPSTLALASIALGVVGFVGWRRRRRAGV